MDTVSVGDVFLRQITPLAAACFGAVIWKPRRQRGGALPNAGSIGIFICDKKGNILEANQKFLEMIGYSPEQIARDGYPALGDVTGPETRREIAARLREAYTKGRSPLWRQDYISRDGRRTPALSCAAADPHAGGIVGFAVDLSGEDAGRRLAALPGQILVLHDEERRKIARELHDTTAQNLAALAMNLTMLRQAAGMHTRALEMIDECASLTEQCLREVRGLSYELHPPLLDELGLEAALRAYSDIFTRRSNIQVFLNFPAGVRRLEAPVESALFRIAQEALENIRRHSGSSKAELTLQIAGDRRELIIRDYGRGLDVERAAAGGMGLSLMAERARYLGGWVEIDCARPGVMVRVVIPGA
jgi:PAS domain S-box-containing protein